ncbi:hypothetical protein A3D66_02225 [Candidatus Kaiserbacteria bacterium RIFCSPHIGHO2_02_FULL_50_9]|uniref:UDP-N-acetylglucosamine 2-epimerase domain-containing protein n=1 Tax=Candidatus Kaiserbacteria bacterium RIFCSPLOWO2_01_FULL_51_21 TaxID=1798508 RepID=A0A1F6EEC6_9BACT|nr:MAG: hypothetical protein A2761_03400 [Candidatus Kaiserbacteria bacterium RIFCSPHIGHO2_01_FULL_51_33]OGG63418.1 MAG: hypothetical protein A3D66_02225 [Candidatus Kaiserbacteria bacterium RIFCSPHIGHO2_02_FULL_50_9]OGG71996.1 MAG: hypothetical protein A3A35_01230 [Candidatus Kaiserbacteria bacterium RIFCSPLOWO2_01_FULL_51_21]
MTIMKTLFLVLPTRLHISDVLHTEYIKELAGKYRVVVFLPTKNSSLEIDASSYYKHPNVIYQGIFDPSGKYWTLIDWLLRPELIRRYEDNPAVRWRNAIARKADKRRRLLRVVMQFVSKNLFSTDFFSFIERYTMPNFSWFKKQVERHHPALIMVASPGVKPVEPYVIACAHRLKLPTVAFDFSWDNLTTYPRHVRKTKYLICWNEFQREAARELHNYPDDRLFVSGTLRFDSYFRPLKGEEERSTFLSSKGLDPNRKTLLFASRAHLNFHRDIIRSFIHWQKEGVFAEPLNFFIRMHPLDKPEDYAEFMGVPNLYLGLAGTVKANTVSSKNNVETEEADWVIKKDSIRHTDICINFASTFSLEAFIFDKPVINIGFAGISSDILMFPHYAPIVETGASRVAMRMEDVLLFINDYLKDPARDRAARTAMVKKFVAPADGYSYKRNIGFIGEILKREGKVV